MQPEKKIHKQNSYTNELFYRITTFYVCVMLLMGSISMSLAFVKECGEILNKQKLVMTELEYVYRDRTDEFWRLYMPIFQYEDTIYSGLYEYLKSEKITPYQKKNLLDALQNIIVYDPKLKWIGIYSETNEQRYMFFADDDTLTEMNEDFPYYKELADSESGKHIFTSKLIEHKGATDLNFAICGDTAIIADGNKLIVGYGTEEFKTACQKMDDMQHTNFYITNPNGVFWSTDEAVLGNSVANKTTGISRNDSGKLVYIHCFDTNSESFQVYCEIPLRELLIAGGTSTLYILPLLLMFFIGFLIVYKGAESRLQKNIEREYVLRIQRKEAELSELQSKFDPHFLYNTLEVIRGRVYENGDIETSDIIIKLAQIFRSFIGSERFVSIRDEMDFCNMYLSLLKYRYEDRITIIYDIESEIMEYGIIRNLLQPILENFFVHGFKPESQHNMLEIRGKVYDEKYIWFYIWDNGLGIPEEKLIELKESFKEVESSAQSSYGLKNVQRRIKLFYGRDCGLEIKSNEAGGTTVEVKIRRLTCIGHEMRMYDIEDFDV